MVCHRCILCTEQVLQRLSIPYDQVSLGFISLSSQPSPKLYQLLKHEMQVIDLPILEASDETAVEEMKQAALAYLQEPNKKTLLSVYVAQEVGRSYGQLSRHFSNSQGITFGAYFRKLRVAKAQELLQHGQLNSSQVAYRLGFSNVQHLSRQFKDVTGETIRQFLRRPTRSSPIPLKENL